MSDVIIKINNISKTFFKQTTPTIQNISFNVTRNKITGIIGPSNAGKTTLLRIIAGLLDFDKGSIFINETDITKNQNISSIIGYMPQKFSLYEDLTVYENLKLYAGLRDIDPKEQLPIFEKLLKFTSLERFTKRLCRQLSGGMKQKLSLACTIISKPKLLLLDAPTVGVDPISRHEFWLMIKDLIKENITVVWSTSYFDEIKNCDDIIVINDGKTVYNGVPQEIINKKNISVFYIKNYQGKKTEILNKTSKNDEIMDVLIQGSLIRILSSLQKKEISQITQVPEENIVVANPSFEDSFISLIGNKAEEKKITPLINSTKEKDANKTNSTIISCANLYKNFGDFVATDNVSINVPYGTIFGLLGPNGAGKSTIFKMLCGLLKPTSGKIHISEFDVSKHYNELYKNIGYMAQKFSLYNDLTVRQNLNFFSGIYGIQGNKQKNVVEKMIEIFDFKSIVNLSTQRLSLGFRQRLALACATMHNPSILFLDEPTSGADPATRREFWFHINTMVEQGVSIMVTTHFMEEAEYCDNIALIYNGKKIAEDTPEKIKLKTRSENNQNPSMEEAFVSIIKQNMEEKNA